MQSIVHNSGEINENDFAKKLKFWANYGFLYPPFIDKKAVGWEAQQRQ